MFYNPTQQSTASPSQNLMYGGYQQTPYMNNGMTMPIGYNGNNGSYYGTNYYNNFNPYYIKQQQEAYQAQLKESQRNEADFYKTLYKTSCSYLGKEVTQEALDYYDKTLAPDVYVSNNIANLNYEQQITYERLKQRDEAMNLHRQSIANIAATPLEELQAQKVTNPYYQKYCDGYDKVRNDYYDGMPDNVNLATYLKDFANKHYLEARKEATAKNNGVDNLYNKSDFNTIMNAHKSSFSTLFNPYASIDDQEVRLPGYVSEKSRQERRARFINAALGRGTL